MIPGVDELDMATVPHPLRLLGTTPPSPINFAPPFRGSQEATWRDSEVFFTHHAST